MNVTDDASVKFERKKKHGKRLENNYKKYKL